MARAGVLVTGPVRLAPVPLAAFDEDVDRGSDRKAAHRGEMDEASLERFAALARTI